MGVCMNGCMTKKETLQRRQRCPEVPHATLGMTVKNGCNYDLRHFAVEHVGHRSRPASARPQSSGRCERSGITRVGAEIC